MLCGSAKNARYSSEGASTASSGAGIEGDRLRRSRKLSVA